MKKKQPSKSLQKEILKNQKNRCAYCGIYFSTKNCVGTVWDHFKPYSYIQDNPDDNWVASCPRCNSIKRDLIFNNIGDASYYIITRRLKKKDPYIVDNYSWMLKL